MSDVSVGRLNGILDANERAVSAVAQVGRSDCFLCCEFMNADSLGGVRPSWKTVIE